MSLTSRLFLFGSAASFGDPPHWIAHTGVGDPPGTSDSEQGYAVSVDSSNKIYALFDGSGSANIGVARYDPDGTLNPTNSYVYNTAVTYSFNPKDIHVDENAYIYICGHENSNHRAFIAKLTPNFANPYIEWSHNYDPSGSPVTAIYEAVKTDSSGNVYVCGSRNNYTGASTNQPAGVIQKFNSVGSQAWQKFIYDPDTSHTDNIPTNLADLAITSDGSIIAVGHNGDNSLTPADSGSFLVTKWASDGTLQWQKIVGDRATTGKSQSLHHVELDSNDNIYCVGANSDVSNAVDVFVMKMNSSGTVQWQQTVGQGTTHTESRMSVAISPSGNSLYISYHELDNPNNDFHGVVLKCSASDGSIDWSNRLRPSNSDTRRIEFRDTALDSSENVLIVGMAYWDATEPSDILTCKLPPDGSGTGTYGPFTYESYSLTRTITTFPTTTTTLSVTNGAMAAQAGVSVSQTVTYPNTVYNIP